jgi:hypothetical protein
VTRTPEPRNYQYVHEHDDYNKTELVSQCPPSVMVRQPSVVGWAIYYSPSSSSANCSPLLNIIYFSNFSPTRSIFGYSHPAPASRSAQIVTPPGVKASYTTFTEKRSPLQNSFTPVAVSSTADMAIPLPRL